MFKETQNIAQTMHINDVFANNSKMVQYSFLLKHKIACLAQEFLNILFFFAFYCSLQKHR